MTKHFLLFCCLSLSSLSFAQLSPAITSWLQNTTQTGSYYTSGNSNTIGNNILVNCQLIEYSNDYVYVHSTGVPAFPTGPYLDGNPSQATDQQAIFQFPLNPQQNTGTPIPTGLGNMGQFINGTTLFDYSDGAAWDPVNNTLCGQPLFAPCPGGPNVIMDWNRDAVLAERGGYDCAKGHPAGGNYHHHQNPSAFKLDKTVLSTICNLYDADGLYMIDSTTHSPIVGYAYDGFPIYGAYGYKNADGTGGIARMNSSYQMRNITVRTHHAGNVDVPDGPSIDTDYPLGYFREDYEYIANNADDYLDEHNGRFCITPEYPNGTYAYFCTVDEQWNSAYPYAIGPTFYGVYANRRVNSVNEPTTIYTSNIGMEEQHLKSLSLSMYPNPVSDLLAIQVKGLLRSDLSIELYDIQGRLIKETMLHAGSTIAFFDTQALYQGVYIVRVKDNSGKEVQNHKITVQR